MRIHLDTDIGTNPDDACALAMLLGWPDAQLVGVTTTCDPEGRRAAYATRCLGLLGRADVPVASDARPEDATALLLHSIANGATVVGIGPYTNLARLERTRPGSLARAPVVLMGGWLEPPGPGLPRWGPERDTNVQADTEAAQVVVEAAADLTLSPLAVALHAPLRAPDLPRLRACGALGQLLAAESEAHRVVGGQAELGRGYAGLPDDLVNLLHDPVACAAAVGWPGVTVEEMRLLPQTEEGVLRLVRDDRGRTGRVVVDVDGEAFTQAWLSAVHRACAASAR